MSHVDVTLSRQPAAYRPGEVLEGEAAWTFDEPAAGLELKLCWTTDGNNSAGAAPVIAMRQPVAVTAPEGKQPFRFELPQGPWSFQGKLLSVRWYVEIARDESFYRRADFVLGPEGKVLELPDLGPAA